MNNDTIDKLLSLVIEAPADGLLRNKWTHRLFDAICDDGVEYHHLICRFPPGLPI